MNVQWTQFPNLKTGWHAVKINQLTPFLLQTIWKFFFVGFATSCLVEFSFIFIFISLSCRMSKNLIFFKDNFKSGKTRNRKVPNDAILCCCFFQNVWLLSSLSVEFIPLILTQSTSFDSNKHVFNIFSSALLVESLSEREFFSTDFPGNF